MRRVFADAVCLVVGVVAVLGFAANALVSKGRE